MKKYTIIVIMFMLVSASGFAKKSVMDPQMLEEIKGKLDSTLYAVVISRGICANPSYRYRVVIEDAGEVNIPWEQFDRGSTELKKGDILVLERVTPKKSGFWILFRTLEKREFTVTETYTEKVKEPATSTEEAKEYEVEKQRKVKKMDFFRTRIDFRFNERRHSYAPENIRFILETIGQGFKFFESKEDALNFVDDEVGMSNSVEIGMTSGDVVRILGLPLKKLKNGNKMTYKYKEWIIHFVDGKVSEVEF